MTRSGYARPVPVEQAVLPRADVGSAREVALATMAHLRARELEDDDSLDGPDVMAEIESLYDQADQLTDRLATYSRKITDALLGDTATRVTET